MKTYHAGYCEVCGKAFEVIRMGQKVCGYRCAVKVPKIERQTEAKKTKERKEKVKTRSDWMKEAQIEFNKYIRLRDAHLPCISCSRFHEGQWHAGHFLSTAACPELRFDESNVHRQCQPCNTHLHGNLVFYRTELRAKIGDTELARLEGPQKPNKYTVEDLKQIRDIYRAKAKEFACKAGVVSA